MFFCENDNNMLYIKVNNNDLKYYCKLCLTEYDLKNLKGSTKCIYKQNYNINKYSYKTFLNDNIFEDKTLPVINNLECINSDCITHKDKKIIKEVLYIKYNTIDMKFIYFCNHCKTKWFSNDEKN